MKTIKSYYVYLLLHMDVPFYVGKGYGNRMYHHENCVKQGKVLRNKHLYYKIKKILDGGELVVYKKVLENASEQIALNEERAQIKKYGRADIGTGVLCNMTDGGEGTSGCVYSEEVKLLRKINATGNKNPMFGKNHSLTARIAMSVSRRNRVWNFTHTEEHKRALRIENPGGKKTAKPIYQLDVLGNVICEWPSARAAAKALDISHGNISYCATKKQNRKTGGFYWRLKT